MSQSVLFHDDGSYQFYYDTGKDGGSHSRSEMRRPDGVVVGKYSYEDPTGEIREVSYRADGTGYVATGDVSVKGAPKGQFPFVPEEHQIGTSLQEENQVQQSDSKSDPESPDVQSESALKNRDLDAPSQEVKEDSTKAEEVESVNSEAHQDDNDKDDMKDLSLEESTVDGPPEAFPQGFFLQNFQGLRRLRDPPKEEAPTTTEVSTEGEATTTPAKEENESQPTEASKSDKKPGADFFLPLKPFPNFSPQQWASSMFHQPVYVFSYQQPDSYGYHYYF